MLLIDHMIQQEIGKEKYQKDQLMNIKQVAEVVGITVASVRHHISRHNLTPVCLEKQYPDSKIPVHLFAKKDVMAFKANKRVYAKSKGLKK